MLHISATEYEIRRGLEHDLSANYSVIMPGDVVQGNLSAPATAGTVEEFTVQLPKGENNLIMMRYPYLHELAYGTGRLNHSLKFHLYQL